MPKIGSPGRKPRKTKVKEEPQGKTLAEIVRQDIQSGKQSKSLSRQDLYNEIESIRASISEQTWRLDRLSVLIMTCEIDPNGWGLIDDCPF